MKLEIRYQKNYLPKLFFVLKHYKRTAIHKTMLET